MHPTPSLKPKPCKVCGDMIEHRISGFHVVCSLDCTLANLREKNRRGAARKQAKRDRELKLGYTPKAQWMAKAEKAVRLYCRVRDAADPCISCGRTVAEVEAGGYKVGGHWDGGHFISKGSHPEIRLLTTNIHKQCKSCNGGSGKYTRKRETVQQAYRANLVAKIGLAKVEWLEGPHDPHKPDAEYLQRVAKIFNKRAKHLKKLRGEGYDDTSQGK